MECPKCGTQFDGNFCPDCGQFVPTQQEKFKMDIDWSKSDTGNQHLLNQPITSQWQQHNPHIQNSKVQQNQVIQPRRKKSSKIVLIILTIIFVIFLALMIAAISSIGGANPTDSKDIAKKYDISENLATSFISSVEQIGLNPKDIEIIDVTKENDQVSFQFEHKEYDDSFTAIGKDEKIQELRYFTFSLIENENLIGTVQEKTFTSDEKVHMIAIVETYIESILKAPKTAEFANPIEWKLWQDQSTGIIMGNGYVDSENSFGAMIRSNFEFTFERGSEDFELTSLTFDGEKIL